MRVAYICADPGIPVFGTKGASVHVQEVIKGMLQNGLDVTLFAQRLGGEPPEELKHIPVHVLPALPNSSNKERALAALVANAEVEKILEDTEKFDLIYERYSLWSQAGMHFAKKHGCIGILEVNAPLIEEQKKHRELPLEKEAQIVAESVFANADAMIAVSPGVKHYLETFDKAKGKIHVIANGVDLSRFAQAATENAQRLKQFVEQGEMTIPTIGFLGTLKPWHGVSILVQAWSLLRERGYNTRLLIVGDGPQYQALSDEIEKLGLLEYVQFTGAVAPETVPMWLAKMDIAVAPYPTIDKFYFSPLKIYEYMAAGLPIIATRVGHLDSVIENNYNGILVVPDEPSKMANSIAELFVSPSTAQQLGQNARFTAEQYHSWLSVVERILDIARSCKNEKN
ncbi:glycosyltransferase family 4 protein [Pasteurella oralis]|uniref:glycosyltransferase family 4 protein n=1 Tax=Pasteurella oralis TaxID=1071947 RepID=UPI000C7B3BA4|nr:glycosyltransferase family 4 protein [Pasteurella oralis]